MTCFLFVSDINYFHCLEIVKILKGTSEGEKKNIFGQYSSQKMKDWNDIIRIYEKDCMFLGMLLFGLLVDLFCLIWPEVGRELYLTRSDGHLGSSPLWKLDGTIQLNKWNVNPNQIKPGILLSCTNCRFIWPLIFRLIGKSFVQICYIIF